MSEWGTDLPGRLAGLLTASHLMGFEELAAEVNQHTQGTGLHEISIFLTDLQSTILRRMPAPGSEVRADEDGDIPVEGTVAGKAFQYGQLAHYPQGEADTWRWWVPLLDGTERLGVMAVTAPDDGESTRQDLELLASVAALLLTSKSGSSDTYARLMRTEDMNVAAEMQWQLMPPRTYAGSQVVIGAVLEPAYKVGGDAFDYALDGHVVHLAVFDSMGHNTSAGVAANLAVAAYRNGRRRGLDLAGTSVAVENALIEEFARVQYVTAVLADLDSRTGELTWVSRGHPPPVVIRGNRWSSRLECPPAHPMGTDLGIDTTVCHERLEPGDRVILYTDGITEARGPAGQEFGLDQFVDFLIRHHADQLPVPETLRRLMRSLLAHHRGRLADDATVVMAEWLGPSPRRPDAQGLVGLPEV